MMRKTQARSLAELVRLHVEANQSETAATGLVEQRS
jgi:hypothetical protein